MDRGRWRNSRPCRIADRRFELQKRSQLFIGVHTENVFRWPRCASAIQIVRPLESTVTTQPQLHPALLSFSAMISQYRFTQPGFWLFYSPNGIKNQTATEFRSLYRGDCPIFPNPLAPGFTARVTIGEGHEVVNYSSRVRVAFGVANVRWRAYSSRSRDGLLAWRRFRRECGLERRTAARRALCS